MKFNSEEHRSIFRAVERSGWRWRNGTNHIVVYPPAGRPLILSTTAQDGPATHNTRSQFRRAGLDI